MIGNTAPHIHEIAEAFVVELIVNLAADGRLVTVQQEKALTERTAAAIKQAIDDEMDAIRQELREQAEYNSRSYEDAVDSGSGPVLERDR